MRAPSLLSQCLTGFITQEKTGNRISIVSERDSHLPSPAVEIVPSKIAHSGKYAGENVDLQGISVFKGRVSVADIISFSSSETLYSKHDGFLKSWESSIDLVNILKHEIRDGQLSFRGKRVLELSCGYALPGTFTCMKGATTVHFQDLSAETVRRVTIPNVLANLDQERQRLSRQPESPFTPSRQQLSPEVRFYAGDWSELNAVLSVVRADSSDAAIGLNRLSSSEEDLMDGCSSQDGSVAGNDATWRRSRKLSGSRAWERASELDTGDGGGYDIILIAEIPYSVASLKKLYRLITKCLRPPYGVVYLAAKKNFVGSKLRSLMDEEGLLGSHLLTELSHSDREIWKFFFLK